MLASLIMKKRLIVCGMYSSIKSCVQINQNTTTEMFSCNKGIRQGDGLSPVLFSLFMNDLLQYFKANHCPGVTLGNHLLNCLMYADDLSVSPSPEGLQQVNTKKSNVLPRSNARKPFAKLPNVCG